MKHATWEQKEGSGWLSISTGEILALVDPSTFFWSVTTYSSNEHDKHGFATSLDDAKHNAQMAILQILMTMCLEIATPSEIKTSISKSTAKEQHDQQLPTPHTQSRQARPTRS